MTVESVAATFSKGVVIPEMSFIAFQATFAAITCTLIVGSFAERIKFSAVLLFCVLWFTFSYIPIAHMVWYWDGPDAITSAETLATVTANAGWLWQKGALDFAGGTVVHINAGVAGLVGAYLVGKRIGYGRESMAPHSLTLTMIGASLLWVGWFGFNAGSNLEANAVAGLAFINTFFATAAAVVAWCSVRVDGQGQALDAGRGLGRGGRAGGDHAGLRLRRPDGLADHRLVAGILCLWGCQRPQADARCRRFARCLRRPRRGWHRRGTADRRLRRALRSAVPASTTMSPTPSIPSTRSPAKSGSRPRPS